MKDNALVKTHRGLTEEGKKRLLGFALSLVVGALFSSLRFSDRLSPFGVSAVAALPGAYSFFAVAGSILGYAAIGSLSSGVRYISEMLILVAVKWAFAAFLERREISAKEKVFVSPLSFAQTSARCEGASASGGGGEFSRRLGLAFYKNHCNLRYSLPCGREHNLRGRRLFYRAGF